MLLNLDSEGGGDSAWCTWAILSQKGQWLSLTSSGCTPGHFSVLALPSEDWSFGYVFFSKRQCQISELFPL